MKYFSNLDDGWADLKFGQFQCRCSYIQNIPSVILNAWEEYQNTGHCIIMIDGESIEYEIIITEHGIKTFTYDCSGIYYHISFKDFETHQQKYQLLKDLVYDIIDNVDEWAKWLCLCNKNDPQYNKVLNRYKQDIYNKAKSLGLELKGE